jgi:hypothetical protein
MRCDPDLVRLQQAARMALLARVDRDEISPEDVALQMAKVDSGSRISPITARSIIAQRRLNPSPRLAKTGAITNCTTN